MNSLIIDPIVLAYPSLSSNTEELENYIYNLLEWDKFVDETQIDVLISGNTSEILVLENYYPYWDNLKTVFDKSGLNEFVQPRDIII
jgi:flavodoxin